MLAPTIIGSIDMDEKRILTSHFSHLTSQKGVNAYEKK